MKLVLPPILIVAIIALIGAICVWTQEAWLAPSIGAAAFTQMFLPSQPGAKPYGIFVGQLIGVAASFIGVYAVQATATAKFATTICPTIGCGRSSSPSRSRRSRRAWPKPRARREAPPRWSSRWARRRRT